MKKTGISRKNKTFPNIKEMLKASSKRAWSVDPAEKLFMPLSHIEYLPEQAPVPRDLKLRVKLGMEKEEKILVFAGGYGDWAKRLSAFADQAHYTDISKSMTGFVKQHKPGMIKTFRARPAELMPRIAQKYDWSFSFEPFTLMQDRTNNPLSIGLVRSLLNTKGAKIVMREPDRKADCHPLPRKVAERLVRIVRNIGTMYDAIVDLRIVEIETDFGNINFLVTTLATNSLAREKAILDLKILRILRKKPGITNREIAEFLKTRAKYVAKGRERLDKIAKLRGLL